MRRAAVVLAALAVFASCGPASRPLPGDIEGTITVSGAWALYPMALKWAEEFEKIHPRVRIEVQAGGAGKGIADCLSGMVDLGMVSRDIHPEEVRKGALAFSVTRDAVVAVISDRNPYLHHVLGRGLSRDRASGLWMGSSPPVWSDILQARAPEAVHVYTRSDACGAAETWAAFLGGRQEDLGGVGVFGDPGLAEAVRRDPLGIGYNNVNFAYDPATLRPVDGLAIVPLDLDGDGQVNGPESFYATRDDLTKAIADGRYPAPPARDLYLVSRGVPVRPATVAFLRWVLTEGQAFVSETGYIPLDMESLRSGLALLTS